MNPFNESAHPRAHSGKFTHKNQAVSDVTLHSTSRNKAHSLDDLALKNKKAIRHSPRDSALFEFDLKQGRTKSTYRYDSRTERATNDQEQPLTLAGTSTVLKALRDQEGSKVSVTKMKAILKSAGSSENWNPAIPKGANLISPVVTDTDREGSPVASYRYELGGNTHIITSGPKGAIDVWRKNRSAQEIGLMVVHAAEPVTSWDEEHGPRDCQDLPGGKCYADSGIAGYEESKFMFDVPDAKLLSVYNEMFTEDPMWA